MYRRCETEEQQHRLYVVQYFHLLIPHFTKTKTVQHNKFD